MNARRFATILTLLAAVMLLGCTQTPSPTSTTVPGVTATAPAQASSAPQTSAKITPEAHKAFFAMQDTLKAKLAECNGPAVEGYMESEPIPRLECIKKLAPIYQKADPDCANGYFSYADGAYADDAKLCNTAMAILNQDIERCQKMSGVEAVITNSEAKDSCLDFMAISSGNPETCTQISTEGFKYRCFTDVVVGQAYSRGELDKTVCEKENQTLGRDKTYYGSLIPAAFQKTPNEGELTATYACEYRITQLKELDAVKPPAKPSSTYAYNLLQDYQAR